MSIRLFVYGTLKQGFPNHHVNTGRRVPGRFRTTTAYPLWVVRLPNEDRAPWLLDSPGHGYRVFGQLFEVDAASLPEIDRLEEVGLATGYARMQVELESTSDPATRISAFAYLKSAGQLAHCLAREGPFDEYTPELARGYRLARP